MNILFISNDPNLCREGTAVRARMREYADEVARTGGTLHILTRASAAYESVDGPLRIHGARVPKLLTPWMLGRLAKRIVEREHVDVVSAQDPFEHGWAALRAIRGTRTKLHLQVHTDYLSPWFTRGKIFRSPNVRMPFLNRIRIRIADRVVLRAAGIRVVSERVKESMIKKYGNSIAEPAVIPIPVSTNLPPKVPLPEHPFTFTLLSVSRLEPEKRIPDLLAAVRRLKDAYPMLGLVIVGEGRERRRLERLAKSWGISSQVRFLGKRTDARGLMQSANAYVQASAYEGYGLTLIEAALAGLPIITSDVGIVGEVFTGYEDVFAVPVGDPTNLASLIARLIEDHMARRTLSIEGKAAALRHLAAVRNTPADIVANITNA